MKSDNNKVKVVTGKVKGLFERYLDEYEAFLRYRIFYLDEEYGKNARWTKFNKEDLKKFNELFDQIIKSENALNLSNDVIDDVRETLIEKIGENTKSINKRRANG